MGTPSLFPDRGRQRACPEQCRFDTPGESTPDRDQAGADASLLSIVTYRRQTRLVGGDRMLALFLGIDRIEQHLIIERLSEQIRGRRP